MNDELCVVLSTAPDRASAERIGEALLAERLAACIQYEAIRSQYWWQGALCMDDEVLRLHPYDCPQVLCLPVVAVNAGYAQWLAATLRCDNPQ